MVMNAFVTRITLCCNQAPMDTVDGPPRHRGAIWCLPVPPEIGLSQNSAGHRPVRGAPRFQRPSPPASRMRIKDSLGALVTSTSNSHLPYSPRTSEMDNSFGHSPWYDWAMFRYEKSERDAACRKSYMETTHGDEVFHGNPPTIAHNRHYAPGKILCFVQAPGKTLKAVVLCCAFKHVRSGVFATQWKVEYLDARKTRPYALLMDVAGCNCSTLLDNPRERGGAWLPRRVGEGACSMRTSRRANIRRKLNN
jgi:hypothetical protein